MKRISNGILSQRKFLFLFPLVIIALSALLAPYAMRASSSATYTVSFVNVGTQPAGAVYDPGKGETFVSNYGSASVAGSISVINETSQAVTATISLGLNSYPGMMAYDSVRGEIDVVATCVIYMMGFPLPYPCVKVISDANNTVVTTIGMPWLIAAQPTGIAYDWGKGTIYVASTVWPTTGDAYATSQNNVTVISASTNTVIENLTDSSFWRPGAVTYDPARGAIFIGNTAPDRYDHHYKISVLNDAINDVVATIDLGSDTTYAQPGYIGYDPAKSELFVAEPLIGNVTVISDANYAILASVHLGGENTGPGAIAYDPSRHLMWISDNQYVYALSDATNALEVNVTGFAWAGGLAYDSHTTDVYATDYYLNKVGIIHQTGGSTTTMATTTVTTTVTSTITSRITTTTTTTSIPPPVTTTVTSTHTSTTTQTNTITNTATVTETSVSTTTSTVTETTPVTTTVTTTSIPPPVTTTETSTVTLPQETTTVTSTSISTTTETSTSTSTSTQTVGGASITLNCAPATTTLGRSVRCNAVATAGYPPLGNITFSNAAGTGSFGTQTCTVRANTLTCTAAYTPSVAGTQQMNATYSNDPNFLTVTASTTISVKPSAALFAPVATIASPLSGLLSFLKQGVAGNLVSLWQSSLVGITAAGLVVGISLLFEAQRLSLAPSHSSKSDNKARGRA